jgi:hypothetical protein
VGDAMTATTERHACGFPWCIGTMWADEHYGAEYTRQRGIQSAGSRYRSALGCRRIGIGTVKCRACTSISTASSSPRTGGLSMIHYT